MKIIMIEVEFYLYTTLFKIFHSENIHHILQKNMLYTSLFICYTISELPTFRTYFTLFPKKKIRLYLRLKEEIKQLLSLTTVHLKVQTFK